MTFGENFRAVMRSAGLDTISNVIADGKLHRIKSTGDHNRNSWYVLHAGPPASGAFGCWKRGLSETWCDRSGQLSQAEWSEVRRRWQDAERERQQAESERHTKARKAAAWILSRAKPVTTHGYLSVKGVQPHGDVREYRGTLVLPLRDANGELHSLQFIGEDGTKTFLTGGRIAGCCFTIADKPDGPLVIVEGFATGASVHEASGHATVAAMNCGNLLAIAVALRKNFPSREIIIAADNDQFADGNPGAKKATEAAKAIGALLAFPDFKDLTNRPTDFNDLHQQQGADAVTTQIQSAVLPVDIEWPIPKTLPDDLPAVQSFNSDCLPGTLRPWLEDISERMQCPPDYPAVGAMIALGSIIGRKVGICPKRQDDWLVVPNLWGMAVGRPGLMKTPALEQALAPLNRLVAQALAKYEAEAGAHKVSAMLDAQRTKLSEKAIFGLLKEGNEKGARDLAESNLKDADTAPVLRRYKVNDSTVEKLGELLNQNPNGLLLHRDELVGFLRSLDKEGREDSRAFFLEAWNGTGDFTSDRIGRGTVRIEAITVSIIGAIQPGPVSDYLRQAVRSGVGDDGLLQRFQLAVWPDTSKEWRNIDRWPDSAAKNDAFTVFQYLDTLTAASVGADCLGGIPFLRFAPGAQERFDLWRAELEKTLRSDCDHPAFEAHLAKYRKLVPALALIHHLGNRDTGPVTLAALEQALLWASYLESHARRIYSAVLRPDSAAARELAKHLKRGELPERFTLRETYRKGWAGLSSKEDAEAATEILCDLGWIRPVAETGRATGRPASPTFETNPKSLTFPRSKLPELTKPTSGGFVSEAHPVVENSRDARSEETKPLRDEKPGAVRLVEEFA